MDILQYAAVAAALHAAQAGEHGDPEPLDELTRVHPGLAGWARRVPDLAEATEALAEIGGVLDGSPEAGWRAVAALLEKNEPLGRSLAEGAAWVNERASAPGDRTPLRPDAHGDHSKATAFKAFPTLHGTTGQARGGRPQRRPSRP